MDFSVRQVLLLSSFSILFGMGMVSCQKPVQVMKLYNADTAHSELRNGQVFYQNKTFTGIIYKVGVGLDTLFKLSYKDGLEEGAQTYWYPDGKIKEQRHYAMGKKIGTHYGYWENGNKKFVYRYQNDLYEGEQRFWFDNGILGQLLHYKEGHENGQEQVWGDDDKPLANYEARNGRNYGNIGEKHCVSKVKQ